MVGIGISYVITGHLLRALTPAFGKLAAQEASLEVLYLCHQRSNFHLPTAGSIPIRSFSNHNKRRRDRFLQWRTKRTTYTE